MPALDCTSLRQIATATESVATLSRAANDAGETMFRYADLATLASTIVGASFVGIGLFCIAIAALSSPGAATAMAVLLWLLLILVWVVCGASYAVSVGVNDACLALGGLVRAWHAARCPPLCPNAASLRVAHASWSPAPQCSCSAWSAARTTAARPRRRRGAWRTPPLTC
jgi:hypothetical protein